MEYTFRRLAAVSACALVLSSAALPTAASATSSAVATATTIANIRTQPTTTSTIAAQLTAGASVDVVCWTLGEPTFGPDKFGSMWLFITAGGWIHSFLLTPVDVPACSTSLRVLYNNCDAARAAGAAPVFVGEPGYGLHLDRDRDGVGCEWPHR